MTISLRQLEYFVAIVEEESFTRAAERLHVSQPGLSRQFQALEKAAGGPLVERLPRHARPTPAGRAMLPHARAALAEAARARDAARSASGAEQGELHVAALYSVSLGVLPDALRVWRRERPGMKVKLVEFRHTDDMAAAMREGLADVAIGPAPADWDGPVRDIGTEEFVLVVPPGDPLTELPVRQVPMASLASRDWVHFTPESGLSTVLDRACLAAGFEPRVAVRTEQGPTAARLAAAGLGLGLVPANVLAPQCDGHLFRPEPRVLRALTAYTRGRPDPVTRAFVDVLADHAQMTPPHVLDRLAEPTVITDPA
ncbi:LysR substrate-binding domain-containing protein [Lentzea sp. JNUCC 0626]|uniref:LysR substrate-binding domain-containing protein n=1 Tax=Lentzea sp. JNUCC 0626 TaxID=3367513 RepID=UPI0037481143